MVRVASSVFYRILDLEDSPPTPAPKKFHYHISLGNTEYYITLLKCI